MYTQYMAVWKLNDRPCVNMDSPGLHDKILSKMDINICETLFELEFFILYNLHVKYTYMFTFCVHDNLAGCNWQLAKASNINCHAHQYWFNRNNSRTSWPCLNNTSRRYIEFQGQGFQMTIFLWLTSKRRLC